MEIPLDNVVFADLHLHSKYSRATSSNLSFENLVKYAKIKGLNLLGRRIHLAVLVPNIETAEKINEYLDTKGRRDYDGRPIFKITCEEFVKELTSISKAIEIIPAHIWTPWFGLFGSKSGFDSLKECFGSQIENIHAIETGMSSDPKMNWNISELNNKAVVSFSDSHSFWPFRLGREATIFKKCDSYFEII